MTCAKILLQAPCNDPTYFRSVLKESVRAHLSNLGFDTTAPRTSFIENATRYDRFIDGSLVEVAHVVPYE